MIAHWLRMLAAAGAFLIALACATTLVCNAQSWQWNYVTRAPNSPPNVARSSVVISVRGVRLAYTVPMQNRQVVIESCAANLSDIANATTLRSQGVVYLFVRFKPARNAACQSGMRPAVALPSTDYSYVTGVAAAINRSCCELATPARSPQPAKPKLTSPSPYPAPLEAFNEIDSIPLSSPAPISPPSLIRRGSSRLALGQTGTALLRLTIAPSGVPQDVTIVSITNRRLSAAAIETAVSSTYAPAKQAGRAITANYVATFSFDGADPALASIPLWKRTPVTAPSTAPQAVASPLPSPLEAPSSLPSPLPVPQASASSPP